MLRVRQALLSRLSLALLAGCLFSQSAAAQKLDNYWNPQWGKDAGFSARGGDGRDSTEFREHMAITAFVLSTSARGTNADPTKTGDTKLWLTLAAARDCRSALDIVEMQQGEFADTAKFEASLNAEKKKISAGWDKMSGKLHLIGFAKLGQYDQSSGAFSVSLTDFISTRAEERIEDKFRNSSLSSTQSLENILADLLRDNGRSAQYGLSGCCSVTFKGGAISELILRSETVYCGDKGLDFKTNIILGMASGGTQGLSIPPIAMPVERAQSLIKKHPSRLIQYEIVLGPFDDDWTTTRDPKSTNIIKPVKVLSLRVSDLEDKELLTMAGPLTATAPQPQPEPTSRPNDLNVRAKAEAGDASAQFDLGVMYADGNGVPKDNGEALKWYRLSAENGYALGQAAVGFMYDAGRGVRADPSEAAKWYGLAAAQGDAGAQRNLGVMYSAGRGVAKDDAEAARLFGLSAAKGDSLAQLNLGISYANGLGVTRDYPESIKWLRLAAANGDATTRSRAQKTLATVEERQHAAQQSAPAPSQSPPDPFADYASSQTRLATALKMTCFGPGGTLSYSWDGEKLFPSDLAGIGLKPDGKSLIKQDGKNLFLLKSMYGQTFVDFGAKSVMIKTIVGENLVKCQ